MSGTTSSCPLEQILRSWLFLPTTVTTPPTKNFQHLSQVQIPLSQYHKSIESWVTDFSNLPAAKDLSWPEKHLERRGCNELLEAESDRVSL